LGTETDTRLTFDGKGGGQMAVGGAESLQFGYWDAQWVLRGGTIIVGSTTSNAIDMNLPGVYNIISKTDWVRFQARINFAANFGAGSVSLFYRNLTRGDADFQPVPNFQNISLRDGIQRPSTWNTLTVFTADDQQVTNILPGLSGYVLRVPSARP